MILATPVSSKTIVATIEARMGSSRLPGKMAKEIVPGLTALGAVIDRLKHSSTIQDIVVATTTDPQDDVLAQIASAHGISSFRGSEADVLGRVVGAGRSRQADILVLVTGDCTCVSPKVIDGVVHFFLDHEYDLVSNCVFEDSYPIGIDAQVVAMKALKRAYSLAQQPPYVGDKNNFEHTNFFIKHHPELFRVRQLPAPEKYRRPELALALDTPADLEVMRAIYTRLYPQNPTFDIDEILDILDTEPAILAPLTSLKVNRLGY